MEKALPNHIAIILDGNGRWAKKRGLPRNLGHTAGVKNLVDLAKYGDKIGLKKMTVFAFSTENWNRPENEVSHLLFLLREEFKSLMKKMDSNVRITVIGEKEKLSPELLDIIKGMENKTKDYTGMNLEIAFNYGSRDEIIHAVKEMVNDNEEITKENLSKHLYTDDVDLLIRTSGEERISNFLLWQISYSELYFTDTLFPDFGPKDLDKAIEEYNKRDRRFGKIKEEDNK